MVNPVLSRPSEVWMLSHRSRPIGNADTSGHRILASRSTIRQADSRDRPTPGLGSWLLHNQNPEQVSEPSDGMSPTRNPVSVHHSCPKRRTETGFPPLARKDELRPDFPRPRRTGRLD